MLRNFKDEILAKKLNEEQLFQKYLIDSTTFIFSDILKNTNQEYDLKADFASVLHVQINDIYIVGSGKTGFSLKPKEFGRTFDGNFETTKVWKDRSDIDIAIVSTGLFDFVQESIYDWSKGFRVDWDSNKYYESGQEKFGIPLKYMFLEYLGKGWYRPDLAPKDFSVETDVGTLNEVAEKWRAILKRKTSWAIYKNWHFFKKYQVENIKTIRDKIESGAKL